MRKSLLAFATFSILGTAQAQMDWITPQIEGARFGDLIRRQLQSGTSAKPRPSRPRSAGTDAASASPTVRPTVQRADAAFPFQSTPASRKAALDGYLQRVARSNPETGARIAVAFHQHDAFAIYDQVTTPFGLKPNDAADALTAYSILGYLIATGASDPSPAQVAAVRSQISSGMTNQLGLVDPAIRTAFGEDMKLLFVTLHSGWKSAIQDDSLARFRKDVGILFARQGRDFSKLRLTSVGFVPR